MEEDLKEIELNYGTNMMKLCKEIFPQLLKIKGLLPNTLKKEFAPSKLLYKDLLNNNTKESFKNYIYGLLEEIDTEKTPEELLKEAGYKLYICEEREQAAQIKKMIGPMSYTFHDIKDKYVFGIIKENLDKIEKPKIKDSENDYSKSVAIIIIDKGKNNILKIIGRYGKSNRIKPTVFYNNLDNIVPGLTKALEKKYNIDIIQNGKGEFELLDYVKAKDKRYYKYNYKIGNIFYGPNNIIIDNYQVIKDYQDKRYILIDNFIIDLLEKKAFTYKYYFDAFIETLKKIETIDIIENKIKIQTQTKNNIEIEIDENNRIISYKNEKLRKIDNNFLSFNRTLKRLEIPNVVKIGECCLYKNEDLTTLIAPNLIEVETSFLKLNNKLEELILPNLEFFGRDFLYFNNVLKKIDSKLKTEIENREVFEDIRTPKTK